MKVSDRFLRITIIALVILIILFGFGWANSLVSYKYEVQDSLFAKRALDQHQKDILQGIAFCKGALLVCVLLFIALLTTAIMKPHFKNRLRYDN